MNIRDFRNIWWLFSLSHLASTPWETRKCIGHVQELRQKCKRGGVDKLLFMNEGQVVGIRLSLGKSLGEVRLSGSSPAALTFFFEPVSSSRSGKTHLETEQHG